MVALTGRRALLGDRLRGLLAAGALSPAAPRSQSPQEYAADAAETPKPQSARFRRHRIRTAPAPDVPAGIRIDQLDPELDVAAAFDAHHEAFADHWGETEETPEEFRHWLIDTPPRRC